MSTDNNLATLIGNITMDGDKYQDAYRLLPSCPTLGDAQRVFDALGLRWNPVVEQDAVNAINDCEFDYFTDRETFAEQARWEMHISRPERFADEGRFVLEICREIDRRFATAKAERDRYGVPVSMFLDNEWACPREQERFYKTDAWRRCSAAQRYLWDYKCRRCGVRGAGLHVHHLMPIMSGYGRNFDLNFADWKLTLYCEDCHRDYHRRAVRGHASHEYDIVDEADARKDKAFIRQAWKVVHELGRCQYCACHQVQLKAVQL